jgi:hypothetical protein
MIRREMEARARVELTNIISRRTRDIPMFERPSAAELAGPLGRSLRRSMTAEDRRKLARRRTYEGV